MSETPQLSADERTRIRTAPDDLVGIYFDIDGVIHQVDFDGRIVGDRIILPFGSKVDAICALREAVDDLSTNTVRKGITTHG